MIKWIRKWALLSQLFCPKCVLSRVSFFFFCLSVKIAICPSFSLPSLPLSLSFHSFISAHNPIACLSCPFPFLLMCHPRAIAHASERISVFHFMLSSCFFLPGLIVVWGFSRIHYIHLSFHSCLWISFQLFPAFPLLSPSYSYSCPFFTCHMACSSFSIPAKVIASAAAVSFLLLAACSSWWNFIFVCLGRWSHWRFARQRAVAQIR